MLRCAWEGIGMKCLLLLLLPLLAACASPVLLVNPATGQTVQCHVNTAWSGLGGAAVTGIGANIQVSRCAQQWEALGYVRADNIQQVKQMPSDANNKQIAAGQQ